jgi:DNA-binding GntR family transcriptional regulator
MNSRLSLIRASRRRALPRNDVKGTGARSAAPRRPARVPRPRSRQRADQPSESLTDRAYRDLEELIVTLKLPPGAAVSESVLSRQLGIGRTPIREALPRRGIMVSEVNVKSQLRLLELRREVERLVARSAARRAIPEERQRFHELADSFERAAHTNDDTTFMRVDREFNELCLVAARNEFAANAMSLVHSLSRRFWYIHYKQVADMPRAAKLHADEARAIASGDEKAAAEACDRLIDYVEEFTRATVSTDV